MYILSLTGGSSSSVGLLRIKGYNKTVGSWHCTPTGVPTTTQLNSEGGSRDIQMSKLTLKFSHRLNHVEVSFCEYR